MPGWMQLQIFIPILLLQFLNIFWYILIWRIFYRWVHYVFPRNLTTDVVG